jgi:hypothetical protein
MICIRADLKYTTQSELHHLFLIHHKAKQVAYKTGLTTYAVLETFSSGDTSRLTKG